MPGPLSEKGKWSVYQGGVNYKKPLGKGTLKGRASPKDSYLKWEVPLQSKGLGLGKVAKNAMKGVSGAVRNLFGFNVGGPLPQTHRNIPNIDLGLTPAYDITKITSPPPLADPITQYKSMLQMNEGGKISIKPENRGKFTAAAKSRGMGVQEFARKVLSADEGVYSPGLRKQANFARNASKWRK